jgi:putative FmdB family regulatory protein
MPLHRHECESCGHRFRILVIHGTENETPTCPECGSVSTRRMMPLVAVQFKGSGFYKTDHGPKDRSRSDRGGTETESRDSGPSRPSRDAKPSNGSKDTKDSSASNESKGSAASAKTSSPE